MTGSDFSDTQWDRVYKKIGSNFAILGKIRVAVVGVGSLGSSIAELLAMSGVRRFILIDPDTLSLHNVVRHAAGISDVGRLKVDAVADILKDRNPYVSVSAIGLNVFDCIDELQKAHIVVIAGLGSEIATAKLASMLREMNKTVLFTGLYEKAVAGEAFIVFPDQGPCYACFASILRTVQPESSTPVNYGVPLDEVTAQPGLGVHVMRVAVVAADWIIRMFINNDDMPVFAGNLAILSNEKYTLGTMSGDPIVISPSSSYWMNIDRNEECLICSLPDIDLDTADIFSKE